MNISWDDNTGIFRIFLILSLTGTALTHCFCKPDYAKSKYCSVTNRDKIDNWSFMYCLLFVLSVQTATDLWVCVFVCVVQICMEVCQTLAAEIRHHWLMGFQWMGPCLLWKTSGVSIFSSKKQCLIYWKLLCGCLCFLFVGNETSDKEGNFFHLVYLTSTQRESTNLFIRWCVLTFKNTHCWDNWSRCG